MTNKLICPNCNTAHELGDYINATDADMAFNVALDVPAAISSLVLQYTELFTPAKSKLSLSRRANIIKSLHLEGTDIHRVAYGITAMLERHSTGDLITPLKNHNYLFKVMQSYTPPDEAKQKKYTLSQKQIKWFGFRLTQNTDFAMKYAKIGEEAGAFLDRVEYQLQDPKWVEKWWGYIEQISQQANS